MWAGEKKMLGTYIHQESKQKFAINRGLAEQNLNFSSNQSYVNIIMRQHLINQSIFHI